MLPPQVRTAIRKSDRKAAQLLGFTITRDIHTTDDDDDDEGELFIWDVSNPFAPPDPADERLRNLIQAEIARMRRYESVGPLQSLPHYHHYDDSDSDETDADADDEDEDDDDDVEDKDEDEDEDDKSTTIVLPRLLHSDPLCFITSTHPPSLPSSPSPTPSSIDDVDPSAPWADLAEAEEQEHARKAKRDAHRSRLKALAILGPEASSAI